jgi:hypothetical protein
MSCALTIDGESFITVAGTRMTAANISSKTRRTMQLDLNLTKLDLNLTKKDNDVMSEMGKRATVNSNAEGRMRTTKLMQTHWLLFVLASGTLHCMGPRVDDRNRGQDTSDAIEEATRLPPGAAQNARDSEPAGELDDPSVSREADDRVSAGTESQEGQSTVEEITDGEEVDEASPTVPGPPLPPPIPSTGVPTVQLPFNYTRPDVGLPLTSAEVTDFSEAYLDLLSTMRYFDLISERAHGISQTHPSGDYWYKTWWGALKMSKNQGVVTYHHPEGGSDNNGLRTAPLLEGAVYAHYLWGQDELLVNALVRGFNSWIMAMQRTGEDQIPLMTRAAYPPSFTTDEYESSLYIDYSLNRPGLDNHVTSYIHQTQNPYWDDLYIKNTRSKDDIGHMFRALVLAQSIGGRLSADASEQLTTAVELYENWAKQVEQDNWRIATVDENWDVTYVPPPKSLATFTPGVECMAQMTLRLYHQGVPDDLDCNDGLAAIDLGFVAVNELNPLVDLALKRDAKEILRSFHEAAILVALLKEQNDLALNYLQGLAARLDYLMDLVDDDNIPEHSQETIYIARLLMQAANVGVPLTSREVRYLHARFNDAIAYLGNPSWHDNYNILSAQTPDGVYEGPWNSGVHFVDVGLALGACASPYRNPDTRDILDCSLMTQSFRPGLD